LNIKFFKTSYSSIALFTFTVAGVLQKEPITLGLS